MKLLVFLLVGVLLGPSVCKVPPPENFNIIVAICANLFLFVAGIELNLRKTRYLLPQALRMTGGAFALPFIVGFATAFGLMQVSSPESFSWTGSLFLAVALSVSALPVTVQMLKDLSLYETDFGRLIISTATLCDVIAWLAMTVLIQSDGWMPWLMSHLPVLFFFAGLICSDLSFWQSSWTRHLEKASIWIFAPVFFVSIGWKLNVWQHLNISQLLIVLITATTSKFLGSYVAAQRLGFTHKKSTLMGLALNSRGAVEIMIASLALQQRMIDETLFTTLVVMALITTMMAEPLSHYLKLTEE